MFLGGSAAIESSHTIAAATALQPIVGRQPHDVYADDLAELMNALDRQDVVVVEHSTGGGEVPRYIAAMVRSGSVRRRFSGWCHR